MTHRTVGQRNHCAGKAAEAQVATTYERTGRQVLHRRWRGPGGEIDLIAREGDILIFVEVKKAGDFARAAQSLTPRQCRRIAASAEAYLADEPAGSMTEARFDVALVNATGVVQILENAFFAD